MVARGAYADMTNLLPKYGKDVMKAVPSFAFEAAKIDGKIYAVPNYIDLGNNTCMFVNTEIFNKYKLPSSIKTMDELDPYMEAIKKGGDVQYPLYGNTDSSGYKPAELLCDWCWWLFLDWTMQAKIVYKDNYKVENIYKTSKILRMG